MIDFNAITEAQENAAAQKFRDHNQGIILQKYYTKGTEEDISTKWNDLIDPRKVKQSTIKDKMISVYRDLVQKPYDPMLGDSGVAFTVTDAIGNETPFTFEDMYLCLRSALKKQQQTASYLADMAEIKTLEAAIEKNKTKEERLNEGKAKLAELKAKYSPTPVSTVNSQPNVTVGEESSVSTT